MTSVAHEAGKQQEIKRIDEGEILRQYIKREGWIQEDFARKVLSMTPQNLSHHMRKKRLTADFKRLLKENGIHLFSESDFENNSKKKAENNENKIENIPLNIPIKDKRLVYVSMPKDWTKEDVELVIEYLKLMLKSMT